MGKLSAAALSLLTDQFKHELSNSLRYLARSSWARFRGFEATADFFYREAQGEREHADKVRKWIEDRNEALVVEPYNYADASQFDSFDALFLTAIEVERDTTARLEKIYASALAEGDFLLLAPVSELLVEQIEEENLYQTIIDRIVARGTDLAAAHDIDVWIGEQFGD